MPQISLAKREIFVKDGEVLIKEQGILRHRRKKSSIKHLNSEQYYERRKQLREERAREISNNSNLAAYVQWIITIQEKLGLSNIIFAKRIGVTAQTVKLWKRKSGHLPSKMAYNKLVELDLEARIPVITLKIKYGVRM